MTEQDNRKIKAALDACLSGVDALPSMRADILRAAKGEEKVKHRLNKGLVLILALILMTGSVAVAAGLGIFGQLGQRDNSDSRLTGLETASAVVDKVITTEEGVTITINQAYYDGTRVFISYIEEGPFDQVELGEGDPGVEKYDWEYPGEVYGESFGSESPTHQVLVSHLNGSAPRWAKTRFVNIHDGMQMGEAYLEIIGGDHYYIGENMIAGWKECVVPAELAADEITVSIGVFTTGSTYYQDTKGLYQAYDLRGETTWHSFTVKKDTSARKMVGSAKGADWTATADVVVSAIDVRGEVRVVCPESWHTIQMTWENPDKIDYIDDWQLYVDGAPVDGYNEYHAIGGMGGEALTMQLCYKLDNPDAKLTLVPVYRYSGEKPEEAIVLAGAE